ncbi:4'-phosphopantetheinyl transferase family protein [Streptomyces zaomyceticus]|uniref:4'-phosphopantetheinyl transferase superfamily protein n=1 Tax=Streptomyces zaomyceticus TaxID=68286 RepID=A0ABZ1L049_9ACTN|nr:4'-phosphopantetheinyl transferase superfamily protein [Streptomyces zaomyceticus]WSQ23429.1 4'-phosphopantetheinyl transferase superfamily protein [Streptomyces zaomyceticus]
MIASLLPAPVVTAELFHDPPGLAPLFPEEERVVGGAVAARCREFASVRSCARRALGGLGLPPVPLLPGAGGAPRWPEGVVGSMTHCRGYRAAAVARGTDLLAIGCDAEPNEPLPSPGTLELVSLPQERVWLREFTARRPAVSWDRLLFSAKESVYKTWFPLTGRPLDFDEAVITPDPVAGTFRAELLVPGPVVDGVRITAFDGRWCAGNGLVVTAIGLRPVTSPGSAGSAGSVKSAGSARAGAAGGGAVPFDDDRRT